jgi:hypothetical protein
MNSSRIAVAATLLVAGALTGCVTAVPVPVHSARPPHSLGRNVLQFDLVRSANPVVGPDLAQHNLQLPAVNLETDNSLGNFSIRFGVLENLDLEYETTTTVSSGSTDVYAVKYQWLGKPLFETGKGEWMASLRVKYLTSDGDADDTENNFDSLLSFQELKGRGIGAQQTVGYQFTDWLVLSVAANWHRFTLRSRFTEDASDDRHDERRHVAMLGANASLCALPGSRKVVVHVCYERGVQRMEYTYDSSRKRNVQVSAASVGVGFRF